MFNKSVLFLITFLISEFSFSQTQTPVYFSQTISNANSKGFYQYLPADYATSTKNYPLIIWVHGAGQVGQGNPTDLPKILELGVPKIISEGGFPSSFTVGDSSFSFIIISPQFISWPSGGNVGAMINYAMNNYRVNPDRVYLMGISAGGGAVWEFASGSVANSNKIAAIIPFCGALAPSQALANNIAASNLPVWAFHNTYDGTVPVAYSRNWTSYINSYVPNPNPLAKLTEFPTASSDPVVAHDCWSLVTLPSYKPQAINIYEWLLGYRKRTVSINLPPFASAGQDQGIVLPANSVLDGSASVDPDGVIVSYRWRKTAGPASYIFSDSTSIKPTVSNLVQGIYQFELTVADNLGAVSKDTMIVNAYASLPTGAQQRVLIDVGGTSNTGGTITSSPSINGNVWNNMTDARPGVRVTNALTINNQPSSIGVEVINRIDGTYNSASSPGMGNGNIAGVVGDYPASATTDHALIHSSATNGMWKIVGLQADKIYVMKFWGTRSNTSASRNAEIKRFDDNVWKSYSAANNTNYNNAAVFNISGKTEMYFNIRTKAGSDFSALNVLDISYGSDTIINPPPVLNLPPVARAGIDTSLQLPMDSITISGCSSSDPEMSKLKYQWRKIGGPSSFLLEVDTICTASIKGLVEGTYSVELTVTDSAGLTGKDSVSIIVNPQISNIWPPQVTPLCSRPYRIVVVGSSTAYGTGANPIDSSWVNKFRSYLLIQNKQIEVINIATLGLTSYDVSPTGTYVPSPFTIDTLHNITKALSLNPDAIILNLPSDDVARGIPTDTIHKNFNIIAAETDAKKIPLWVTTTQPRDVLSPAERTLQMDLRDWINITYGNKSVDFWSTVSNADGTINSQYSAGDGVHLNNSGHHILFTRIVKENIWDTICKRINLPPIAMAGNDTIITSSSPMANLNGSLSFDPDGSITLYTWLKLSGPSGGNITNANIANTTASALMQGVYKYELTVTDNAGATSKDTIQITVNAPGNQLPTANAGPDIVITLPVNSTTLNGSGNDPDGNIASYTWVKIEGPAAGTLTNANSAQATASGLAAGMYKYELTVTDNAGATAKDTVVVNVLGQPGNVKKINVNIYGGTNPYADTKWNNWNLTTGLTSSKLNYEDGSLSTVNAVLSASGLMADNGASYAATSTICPPQVLRYNSANTSYRTLTINGLDPLKSYNFEFYASRANTGNGTVYQIGKNTDTISTDSNVSDYAKFFNVSPDNTGKVIVNISRTGVWNYIAGFELTEESTAIGAKSVMNSNRLLNMNSKSNAELVNENNSLTVYPNPAKDIFNIKIPNTPAGSYLITLINTNGNVVWKISGEKRNGAFNQLINANHLARGVYSIRFSNRQQTFICKLIKL
jgi:lysophospholipase L1-like esterase